MMECMIFVEPSLYPVRIVTPLLHLKHRISFDTRTPTSDMDLYYSNALTTRIAWLSCTMAKAIKFDQHAM